MTCASARASLSASSRVVAVAVAVAVAVDVAVAVVPFGHVALAVADAVAVIVATTMGGGMVGAVGEAQTSHFRHPSPTRAMATSARARIIRFISSLSKNWPHSILCRMQKYSRGALKTLHIVYHTLA